MFKQVEIVLTPFPQGFHLITHLVVGQLPDLPLNGILHLFIKHTSAGLTINENADPTVRNDLREFYNRLVPEGQSWYRHTTEGLDDMPAHVKASLIGCSVLIPITNKKLNLGTWQGIFLCEFRDNGGSRKLVATIIG